MRSCWAVAILLCCGSGLFVPAVSRAQTHEDSIVDSASAVFRETMTLSNERIPQKLLSDARGIAIIPNTVKGSFVLGLRHGRGVILGRGQNGNWDPPTFVTLTGGSVGWQAGIQATDVILVFRTQKGLESLFQSKLTLGVDAAVAAGPIGRQAAASTDLALKAEILSYSRSRGLFVGVALDGAVMKIDASASANYYRGATPTTATLPPSAARLLAALGEYSRPDAVAATMPAATFQQFPASTSTPPNTAPISKPQAIHQLLIDANTAMNRMLDDESWRRYLALPSEVVTPGQVVTYQMIVDTLARYDRVAADPRYAALADRPEFTTTRQLLKDYAATLTTGAEVKLELPQPPSDSGTRP